MGCCALCLRRNRCENYDIWHSWTSERVDGLIEMQLYETTNDRVQVDTNKVQTVIPLSMKRSKDSGYSDFVDRLLPEDEKRIQRNYRFLLDNLLAKCVTPRLVQDGFLSPDDETEIRKGLSERANAELLIQKLVHSKPRSFEAFLNALRDTNQEFVALELEKDEKGQEKFPELWTTRHKRKIKQMIERKKSYILKELDPDKILGFFVEQDICQIDSIADMTFKSRGRKAVIVIDCVLQNVPFAFNLLLHALRQTGSEQLASRLHKLVLNIRDDDKNDGSSNWSNSGSLGYKSKESKVKILVNTTLFGGEDEQPLLEAELVERINREERENVRRTLFKEAESTLQEATFGSLILHITPCSKRAYDKLLKFCKYGSFEKILTNLLMDEKTNRLLPKGPLTVKIQLVAKGIIEKSGRSDVATFRDRLIKEFNTVVEEIDPMNFKRSFIDRRLLSAEYFDQLGRSLAQSRSARAADFVEKVLELGDDAVLTFMETIEKKGPEYLLGILKKVSTTVDDIHTYDELIAKLEEQKSNSTESGEILFYETNFRITIQDTISNFHGSTTDSGIPEIRVDVVKDNTSRRSSITSGYTSAQDSLRSNSTQVSYSSEYDPTKDLDGDQML